ncbi:MAG TPA: hypothetical protein VF521_11915 [Pyrinomonadaceae bacterium]
MSTHHSVEPAPPAPIRPATPLGRKLVRYIVGFGVGIGVGLAPYLGVLEVPGFKSLLTFLPNSMRDTLIPLSAALMGMLAVVIQWYGGERISRKWLRKLFARTLLTAILTFVVLIVVRELVVRDIPIRDGKTLSVVVGFIRPDSAPCPRGMSDRDCLLRVTLNPAAIDEFWGERQVALARLSLIFPYLLFTGAFGMLVGLIILKEGLQEKAPPKRR